MRKPNGLLRPDESFPLGHLSLNCTSLGGNPIKFSFIFVEVHDIICKLCRRKRKPMTFKQHPVYQLGDRKPDPGRGGCMGRLTNLGPGGSRGLVESSREHFFGVPQASIPCRIISWEVAKSVPGEP